MANISGNKSDERKGARLVVASAFPQKGEGLTGYNVAIKFANDTLTKKDIEAGKGQSAPMLNYGHVKNKDGKDVSVYTVPYSKEQYDKIMAASLVGKDKQGNDTKPVFIADVFPKNGKLLVNTQTLQTPTKPFDAAKDEKNTKLIRERAAEQRAAKSAEVEAQTETQQEAEMDEPQA